MSATSTTICLRRSKILTLLMWAASTCLCQSSGAQQEQEERAPSSFKLHLLNGQAFDGSTIKGTARDLTFESPLFLDPVQVATGEIDFIQFSTQPEQTTRESNSQTYRVETTNGDVLQGVVTSLDEWRLLLQNPRFGEVSVQRSRLVSILNLANVPQSQSALQLSKWRSPSGNQQGNWSHVENSFQCNLPGSHLFREFDFSHSAKFEIALRWKGACDLSLAFGIPERESAIESLPKLENWGEELIFSNGNDLEQTGLRTDSSVKQLQLVIHWNRSDQTVSIFDADNKLLCKSQLAKSIAANPAICLGNRAGDLTIGSLRWTQLDDDVAAGSLGKSSADNGTFSRLPATFDGLTWKFPKSADQRTQAMAATKFQAAFRSSDHMSEQAASQATIQSDEPFAKLGFWSGMRVSGQVRQISPTSISFQTSWSKQPVRLELKNCRTLRFSSASDSAQKNVNGDRLVFSNSQQNPEEVSPEFVGRFLGVKQGIVTWQSAGTMNAVRLPNRKARIILDPTRKSGGQLRKPSSVDPSDSRVSNNELNTLFLKNGDLISCRILTVDETGIHFESNGSKYSVDPQRVKAIALGLETVSETVATEDSDWQPVRRLPPFSRDNGCWVGKPESAIGHSKLMIGGTLEFDFQRLASTIAGLEIGVLPDDTTEVEFDTFRETPFVHVLTTPGKLAFTSRRGVPKSAKWHDIHTSRLRFQLRLVDQQVVVTVNDRITAKLSRKFVSESDTGLGIYFKVHSYGTQDETDNLIALSGFRRSCSRTRPMAFVNPHRKELALTIPRLQQKSPPPHLLCSTRGDLLRGTLVSMDADSVVISANGVQRSFSRKLISTILWNQHPVSELKVDDFDTIQHAATDGDELTNSNLDGAGLRHPSAGDSIQVWFSDDHRITLSQPTWIPTKISRGQPVLTGQSNLFGKLDLPTDSIVELGIGSTADFQNQPVAFSSWASHFTRQPVIPRNAPPVDGSPNKSGAAGKLSTEPVESLAVTMLDGTKVGLDDLQGKVIVLDFWATWCGPCIAALPEIIEVTADYSPEDLVFIGVNMEESQDVVQSFLKRTEMDFPIAMDPGPLAQQFSVTSLPTTIVIAPDRRIVLRKTGHQPGATDLKKVLAKHLGEGGSN